jgi:hypothetical protein
MLTLILLTSTKWWAPVSASKWRMGFSSAFKGLECVHMYRICQKRKMYTHFNERNFYVVC